MDFGMDRAQEALNRGAEEAEQLIGNPSKVDSILQELEEKLKAVPVIGSALSDLPLMVAMIKAWIQKDYTVVSPKVIACLVGAILYLIRKKDLISDSVPVIGYADDLAVLGLALKLSEKELNDFAEWRSAQAGETAGL